MTACAAMARADADKEVTVMLGRFGRGPGSLLGVEIAHDSIRMLQLHRRRGRYQVAGWAQEPFESPLRGPHPLDDAEVLVRTLRQAHARCATGQRQVALALPASQVICKVCRIPVDAGELGVESRLLDQADRLFPFPLDDLALDFQLLGVSADDPRQFDVLVAACRQSQIDPFEQLFAQADLRVMAVEVDSIALRRALVPEGCADKVILQWDTGEMVMHGWQGEGIAQRRQVVLTSPDQWLEGAERLWRLCGVPAAELLLTGRLGGAKQAGQLAERLGVPCRCACPTLLAGLGGTQAVGVSMALVYGLALGGLA
ncbi:pilus assembly protein PilM [Pseudomonas sp. GD03858]|uniref:type IV pilus biogenesis protein PilM n=1 Tax=unclassified Pseudomonas TaxID=196821 RepID=UPI00244C1863|nr:MULTISPECIES: pilus assembly protein PilM [unclassified Pseudomonas]MDH0648840.1 pilus assembly protein PilM [Pseudomonas sp. GD03867]MDH0664038.1 pilus assembly protein PilM [Pseudomonas sp. GD03858]